MIWLCIGPMVGVGYGMWILPLFESRPVLWRAMIRKPDDLVQETQVVVHNKEGANPDEQQEDGAGDSNTVHNLESRIEKPLMWLQVLRFALAAGFVSMYMAPAIGGLIIVGQMLSEYGTCMKLD